MCFQRNIGPMRRKAHTWPALCRDSKLRMMLVEADTLVSSDIRGMQTVWHRTVWRKIVWHRTLWHLTGWRGVTLRHGQFGARHFAAAF